MGWTQVVSIQGLAGGGKVRHAEPVFYVDFYLKTSLGFGNSRTHWRAELRRLPTGKWSLLLRGPGTGTTVAARQAEELDVFEDPIAATMALKLEGDGSIPKGVHAWREDVFGWLPGVVEEIA